MIGLCEQVTQTESRRRHRCHGTGTDVVGHRAMGGDVPTEGLRVLEAR